MKKLFWRRFAYSVILTMLLFASPLGVGQSSMSSDLSGQARPLATGTHPVLRLNIGPDDPQIDPRDTLFGGTPGLLVVNQLFLGLTRVNDSLATVEPQLAVSWTQNTLATEFTFTLRDDVKWTDGTDVTADDVRYGILRSLDPATGSGMAYTLYPILNAEGYNNGSILDPAMVGITVLDATHIQFNLNASTAHFPAILAGPQARPVPEDAITTHGTAWTEPANIVTNGAYELSTWTHGTSMTLVKNPDYFDARSVEIQQVDFSIVDESTAWTMYLAGLLDSVQVPEAEWAAASADPDLQDQLTLAPRVCTYYYGFNTSKAPFDDPLVRKAFIAAIDRQGLIDAIMPARAIAARTYASPAMVGHTDGDVENIGIPFNPTQAQTWLAAAGYPGGSGFPSVTLMYNSGVGHDLIAGNVRQNWIDNLGVTVTLDDLSWDDYLDLLAADPPHIWRLGWCADHYDARNFLDEGINPAHYGGWSNASYTTLLAQAAQAPNEVARFAYYQDIEKLVTETDAIMAPLYYYAYGMATNPHLYRTFGFGGYGGQIADWYFTLPSANGTLYRFPNLIPPGSAPSGPYQWYGKVVPGTAGVAGEAFHFVAWLQVPVDWQLPWARQYSFTSDFSSEVMMQDPAAQAWMEAGGNCDLAGGAAAPGYKWRAFIGPLESLPAAGTRLTNYVNLRGGLRVPGDETPELYSRGLMVVGVYYDSGVDGIPDSYACSGVAAPVITVE